MNASEKIKKKKRNDYNDYKICRRWWHTDMGRVHPRVGSGRVGSGWVGSICVGLCGSPWIIQNVMLSVIVKFTQFSELLVLLKFFFCVN